MTDGRSQRDNNQGGALGKTQVDLEELWGDATGKAKETGRTILWYIPKVEGRHMYRDAMLDHYMNVAVWSDPAVVALVNRRFVPLRAACAKELKKATNVEAFRVVEPAIAIFDGEGKELRVLQRIRTFNADFIAAWLRSGLDGKAPADASGEELLAGGWFEAAAAKFGQDPLRLAELRRREGKLDEALALCDAASKKGADVSIVRGRALLAAGQFADAAGVLEKSASPEAAYFLAHARRALRHDAAAAEIWGKLAESSPATSWGWRASANVTNHKDQKAYGPATVGFEDVIWPAAAGAMSTRWERKEGDADDIAKRAVAWLLRNQSGNGSWNDSRYAYWPSPAIQPNVHMAVTALACAALLEWQDVDRARVQEAIRAGEEYLVDDKNMARGQNEECYADAYRLLYWHLRAKGNPKDGGPREKLNGLVAKLAAIQKQDGFWAHEYENAFCTTAVLQSLLLARESGATVEDKVLAAGADALIASRDPEGRFVYGKGTPVTRPFDSSGRNAMGEAVLLELKRTERATFEKGLEEFWTHLERRERVRVCDFHSDGEMAGFFFFNNVFHTSQTFKLLEGKARDDARAKMLAHLVKIPEIDGSFIDSHEMGKSYGTAMALLSMKNCLRK
jgi:hypothetical protein